MTRKKEKEVVHRQHNSIGGGVAAEQLRTIIERVEQLEKEKLQISGTITEVFGEAKGNGFDLKAIRAILKIRKKDPEKHQEEQSVLDTYMAALGMLPLFESDKE